MTITILALLCKSSVILAVCSRHHADILYSAQNELQMHYYTAQIVSLHGHLAHHSQSPLTDDPDRLDRICKGRACVIAASNAILSTADRVVRMQMTSLTWLSAYTVFISAVTLLTAFSFLNDTDFHTRDAIQRTFQTAVHVLRYKSYHASQGKSTYLNFLTVSQQRQNPRCAD